MIYRTLRLAALTSGLLWLVVVLVTPVRADETAKLWQALRSGQAFAIMRHELAPGFSDPANFAIGDCATQRNLNDTGRKLSRSTGERFRANGIKLADVFTSQWCRCRETARLLGLGDPADLPPLNSFFEARERRDTQTAALRTWLKAHVWKRPLVLVSHQVNISALTGQYTESGEVLVVEREANGDAGEVLGSL